MPALFDMEFVDSGLLVAYRASAEPQELVIDVATAGKADFPMSVASLRSLLEAINRGAAGGSVFSPLAGFAKRIDGPWEGEATLGPSYRWTVEIAGVAPLFMRNMVEELRRAGANHPVTRLSIVGSLPVDDGPLSMREGPLRGILNDRDNYLTAFPHKEFSVHHEPTDQVANLRVELATRVTPEIRSEFEATCIWWLNVIRNYVSDDGLEVAMSASKSLPVFGSSRSELRAHYREILFKRPPALAALKNLLYRFHKDVAPIAHAAVHL